MRVSSRWLMLFLLPSVAAHPAVPKGANLQISGPFNDLPKGDTGSVYCSQPTTITQVRWRLNHFHPISRRKLHDLYSIVECGYQGTIRVGGRTFTWKNYAASDILMTTYPDGQEHILAGKPETPSDW